MQATSVNLMIVEDESSKIRDAPLNHVLMKFLIPSGKNSIEK